MRKSKEIKLSREQDTYFYNCKGAMLICSFSSKINAKKVLYDFADKFTAIYSNNENASNTTIYKLIKERCLDKNFKIGLKNYLGNLKFDYSFIQQEECDDLFNKQRLHLTRDECVNKLDKICENNVKMLDKECRKYSRWYRVYNETKNCN